MVRQRFFSERVAPLTVAAVLCTLSACHDLGDAPTGSRTMLGLQPSAAEFDAIGDEIQFDVSGSRPGTSWESSDTSVITVDQSGRARSRGPGRARIIGRHPCCTPGEAPVEVKQTIAGIDVEPDSLNIPVGDTLAVRAIPRDRNGYPVDVAVHWAIRDTEIAEIIEPGLIASKTSGDTELQLTAQSRVQRHPVRTRPDRTATAIEIETSSVEIDALDERVHLAARAVNARGQRITGVDIQWRVADPSIAAISTNGVARSRANGSTWIIADAECCTPDSIEVAVQQVTSAIDIEPDPLNLVVGDTLEVRAVPRDRNGHPIEVTVGWEIGNADIVFIVGPGQLLATNSGDTELLLRAHSHLQRHPVRAGPNPTPTAIEVVESTVQFAALDERVQLTAHAVNPQGQEVAGVEISWRVDDSSVAGVTTSGRVRSRGNGSTWVIADAECCTPDSVEVHVEQVPAEVVLAESEVRLSGPGARRTLSAQVFDASGVEITNPDLTWTSTNSNIVEVDEMGGIVAQMAGTAVVVATLTCCSDSTRVTVAEPSVEPWVEWGFEDYANTADLHGNMPMGMHTSAGAQILLDRDQAPNQAGLSRSVRHQYAAWRPQYGCHEPYAQLAYRTPAPTREIWIEWWGRFSPNFKTNWNQEHQQAGSGCFGGSYYPELKLMFLSRSDAPSNARRWKVLTGSAGRHWRFTAPGPSGWAFFADPGHESGRWSHFPSGTEPWDGQWRRYRIHARISPTGDGVYRFWIDDDLVLDERGFRTDDSHFSGFEMAHNMNIAPMQDIAFWTAQVRAWNQNPGW